MRSPEKLSVDSLPSRSRATATDATAINTVTTSWPTHRYSGHQLGPVTPTALRYADTHVRNSVTAVSVGSALHTALALDNPRQRCLLHDAERPTLLAQHNSALSGGEIGSEPVIQRAVRICLGETINNIGDLGCVENIVA